MIARLKYGKDYVTLELPDEAVSGEYSISDREGAESGSAEVERALNEPINSGTVQDTVESGDRVAIVIEDITRFAPTSTLLPPLLNRLKVSGVSPDDVNIVVGLGDHRKLTEEEKYDLVGDIDRRISILNHHPRDRDYLVPVEVPEIDHEVLVNRNVAEADRIILTGDIDPHQLFGYGGGVKNLLPGVTDRETIQANHRMLLDMGQTVAGELENTLREEALAAARAVGVDFILNAVLNEKKDIVQAFFGEPEAAFKKGVDLVDEMYKVSISEKVETVIVSCGGYPKDIDLYQAQKAVDNALKMTQPGGQVILVAECREGWGSDLFEEWVKEAENMQEVIKRTEENFIIGGHKAYLYAKEQEQADLYLYSEMDSPQLEKFITPLSLDEMQELAAASEQIGLLPMGSTTIPVVET